MGSTGVMVSVMILESAAREREVLDQLPDGVSLQEFFEKL
jgi:hypothetical protein